MLKNVIIAAAAKTSLYLPLYIAREANFFDFLPAFQVRIETPTEDHAIDGDSWALNRLDRRAPANHAVRFAICDPIPAYLDGNARVIASLISKAAFWGVDTDARIETMKDFGSFDKLLTYPKGMSGYWIGKEAEKESGKEDLVESVGVPSVLEELCKRKNEHLIAMTAELLEVTRITKQHPKFKVCYSWSEHPLFSNFLLTGLVTTKRCLDEELDLVKGLVSALQIAILLIKFQSEIAVNTLEKEFGATKEEATWVIDQLNAEDIYPANLMPQKSSWLQAFEVYSQARRTTIDREAKEKAYSNAIDARCVKSINSDPLSLLLVYGKYKQKPVPTVVFDLLGLHPGIGAKCRELLIHGQYAEAVFEAFKQVEEKVKERSGMHHLYGTQLMSSAFAGTPPLIQVAQHPSEQNGYRNLFMGCMQALRNRGGHGTQSLDAVSAIEQIAFASLLLKCIDSRQS